MGEAVRYNIDDTDRVAPHVALCHLILRSALTERFSAVALSHPPGETPTARSEHDGRWEWYMAFPPAAYGLMVAYYRKMADLAPDADETEGTILVRLAGHQAAIGLTMRTNDQGDEEVVLHFPDR